MNAHKTLHDWGHNLTEAYDVRCFMRRPPKHIISSVFDGTIVSGVCVQHITYRAQESVDVYGCKIKS